MTNQEFLKRIEADHVERAEYLASESESEVRKVLKKLGIRKLEELEDDTWKRVLHIDESLETVRRRINEVYYYDEREMPTSDKIGMVAALIDYEQRILVARRKLTDDVIRTITDREKVLIRLEYVKKGGHGGDEEE